MKKYVSVQNRVPRARAWLAALGYLTNDEWRSEFGVADYCQKICTERFL